MSKKSLTVTVLFLSAALPVLAQRLSVRAGAGIMWPQEDPFRDIYGNPFPLVLEAKTRLIKNWGLTLGLDWLSKKGQALPLDQGEEEFPLHLEMISIPLSLFYEYSGKVGSVPLGIDLGLGISWHSYKEGWETADLVHKGQKVGPLVCCTLDFRLLSTVGLFTSLRWESVMTGQTSPVGSKINLGGIKLLGGVTLYLF